MVPAHRDPRVEEQFREYFSVFLASGKPLGDADMWKAQARWGFLSMEDRLGAIASARRICSEREPRFIPTPVHHIDDQDWKRRAIPRQVPALNQASIRARERHEAMMKILNEDVA